MKLSKFVIYLSLVTSTTVIAQSPTETPPPPADYRGPVNTSSVPTTYGKQISGGVLNGKAKSLPKPQYPAAARAVGASGPVTVQVLLDETGAVISASAVSGHPLLRAAAVESARGALFSPTLLEGRPVKVSGVITYNFVLPMSLARISFSVALAEATGSFGDDLATDGIKNSLPRDWEAERKVLESLTYEAVPASTAVVPPPVSTSGRFTAIGNSGSNGPRILDSRSREALKEFSELLLARVGDVGIARWNFDIGKALGIFFVNADDDAKFAESVLALEALAVSIPTTDAELADDVRKFAVMARQAVTDRSLVVGLKSEAVKLSSRIFR